MSRFWAGNEARSSANIAVNRIAPHGADWLEVGVRGSETILDRGSFGEVDFPTENGYRHRRAAKRQWYESLSRRECRAPSSGESAAAKKWIVPFGFPEFFLTLALSGE